VYVALGLAAWRGVCAMPTDGLNKQQQ
jgi:hypothetical protein